MCNVYQLFQGHRKMFYVGGPILIAISVGPPPDVSILCIHAIIVQKVPRYQVQRTIRSMYSLRSYLCIIIIFIVDKHYHHVVL